MADKDKLTRIKEHIAVLIRRGEYVVGSYPEYPSDWRHGEIIDPRSGKPFTHAGAWEFIAEILEARGTKLEEIDMHIPKGRKGYVLHERTKDCTIYIKVHFGGKEGDRIIGRSFHPSRGQDDYGQKSKTKIRCEA